MKAEINWFLASRPKTLVAGAMPVLLGSVFAFYKESLFRLDLFLFTLLATLLIQVATNYFNDALDGERGADTEKRLGPQRFAGANKEASKKLKRAALFLLGLAFLAALPLIQERGSLILIIGLCSLFFAYGYTGGPFPLAYNALGELFVLIFFGWLAVAGSFFVQTGLWDFEAFLLGTHVGLFSCALIFLNNMRDCKEDLLHKKRTLATYLSRRQQIGVLTFILLGPVILTFYWFEKHGMPFVLVNLTYPISYSIFQGVLKEEPSEKYNIFLGRAALQLLLFSVLFIIGICLKRFFSGNMS